MSIDLFDSLAAFELYLACEKFKASRNAGDRGEAISALRKTFLQKEGRFEKEGSDIFAKVGALVVGQIVEAADMWTEQRSDGDVDPNLLDVVARECRSILEQKYMYVDLDPVVFYFALLY